MQHATEQIIDNHLHAHIIRDSDLAHLFKGSAARRYALVNKALKKGELVRICRGYYTLNQHYLTRLPHTYYIANRIVQNSFITGESALSFHHFIPERVTEIISVAAYGRNRQYSTPFGSFVYYITPVKPQAFFLGVELIERDQQFLYIATPLRALVDYVYLHKINNANMRFLTDSLRIEPQHISTIKKNEIKSFLSLYRSHYVRDFLKNLLKEIKNG